MALSNGIINEFVKATNDNAKPKSESIVYGTAKKVDGVTYVQLDGSDLLTPVSTAAMVVDGERVIVMIKNHSAIITGNVSSPSANAEYVEDAVSPMAEFRTILANKVDTEYANATYATIDNLNTTRTSVEELSGSYADFVTIITQNFESLGASVGNLDAIYAKIDFSNIGKAAMEHFYANSGLIEDVKIGDATITGTLVGVTILGDNIKSNTVVADKLVIKGEDGLYYKLNTDGMAVSAEQTDYNSLNGSIIRAKTVTAEKIDVDDLVAFEATIAGFNLTNEALYSGAKESVDNTTMGIYMDKEGQMAVGDNTSYIKYFKDSDGSHKLLLAVDQLLLGPSKQNVQNGLEDAAKTATNFVEYDSTDGLQIGDKTSGSWKGFRTRITNTAFEILSAAGDVLASYGKKIIELGKNATDAIIKLCGGKGQIEYVTDTNREYLQMTADNIRVKGKDIASVYSTYTDDSTRWEKSAVNVYTTKVEMYASECIDPTLHDMEEGWNTTEFNIGSDGIDMYSPGNMNLHSSTIVNNDGEMLTATYGSSGIWNYKQWSNGDVELWGSYSVSDLACTTALGQMYRTAVFNPTSFPFTVYNPNLTASYESDGYGAMLWATTTTTQSKPPSYYLVRPTSATISSGKINFHVYGKWKH